jgi:RluA family pseudouridine synthase
MDTRNRTPHDGPPPPKQSKRGERPGHFRRPDRRASKDSLRRSFGLIYEDNHVLAVSKPDGLLVTMAEGDEQTLQDQLRIHMPRSPEPDAVPPAAVHRLDRYTSGIVLFGTTKRGLDGLSRQWRENTIQKTYLAMVLGEPAETEGVIDAPIDDSGGPDTPVHVVEDFEAPARGTHKGARGPLEAITAYSVVETLRLPQLGLTFSVLEVEPRTGRTHQIRAHLAHIGHPIAGDLVYGEKAPNRALRERARLMRQFLHARTLKLMHPITGEPLEFTAKLPGDLLAVLKYLRGQEGGSGDVRQGGTKRDVNQREWA